MPLTWAPPRPRLSKRKTWYRKSRTCICPKFSLFSPPFACPPLCCSLDCVCVHKKYLASKVLLAKSVYGFWILISLHYVEMLLPRCLAPCPPSNTAAAAAVLRLRRGSHTMENRRSSVLPWACPCPRSCPEMKSFITICLLPFRTAAAAAFYAQDTNVHE